MYCKRCGSLIVSGDSLCSNCGFQNVEGSQVSSNSANVQNMNVGVNAPNNVNIQNMNVGASTFSKKKKKKYWLIPVLLFVGGFLSLMIATTFSLVIDTPNDLMVRGMSLCGLLFVLLTILGVFSIPYVIYLYCRKDKTVELVDNLVSANMPLEEKMVRAYIAQNYEKITKQKYSLSAFLGSILYLLYRKLYIISIAILVVFNVLYRIIPTVMDFLLFPFLIVLCLNFNKWYLIYVKKQVVSILQGNGDKSPLELLSICQKKGGTSTGLLIYIIVLWFMVSAIFSSISGKTLSLSQIKDITKQYYPEAMIVDDGDSFGFMQENIGGSVAELENAEEALSFYNSSKQRFHCGTPLNNVKNMISKNVSCVAVQDDDVQWIIRTGNIVILVNYDVDSKDDTTLKRYLSEIGAGS